MAKKKLQVLLAERTKLARGKYKVTGRYDVQIRVNDKIVVLLKDMSGDEANFAYGNVRRAWKAAGLEYSTGRVRYDESYGFAKTESSSKKVKKKKS